MMVSIFNFNLFCIHLIHRGCDLSDMELVKTEIRLQIIQNVRYNIINFRIYLIGDILIVI